MTNEVPEKYKDKIILALGSNLGNRLQNIRDAIDNIKKIAKIKTSSVIFETEAIVPKNAPQDWNKPYLNIVLVVTSNMTAFKFLSEIKSIETTLGRSLSSERWSPRPIDIDILFYENKTVMTEELTIPHKQIQNRAFIRSLLNFIGFRFSDNDCIKYTPLRSLTLEPKFVAVVNTTPDSFSDGGCFLDQSAALDRIKTCAKFGATIVEIGGQSTRPGAKELSAREELKRVESILEAAMDCECNIGIDTFHDEVAEIAIKQYGVKFISNVRGVFSNKTLQVISDYNTKIAVLFNRSTTNEIEPWYQETTKKTKQAGIKNENVILDIGIGFGKNALENWEIRAITQKLKQYQHEIMIGHSRKSFLRKLSNTPPAELDIHTLAISDMAAEIGIDYLRIHNLEEHVVFFSTKKAFTGFNL